MEITDKNQAYSVQSRPQSVPVLRESSESKAKLDSLLLGCFAVQKLYGRAPENLEAINQVFHTLLGKYPADKATRAIEIWMERNQEFPTPADIIGLIKRGGKELVTKEVYISKSKIDPEYRTADDWEKMKRYEKQDDESGFPDEHKEAATLEENLRLRAKIQDMQQEIYKLSDLLRTERDKSSKLAEEIISKVESGESLLTPKQKESTHDATVTWMRENGSTEADIQAYLDFENTKQVAVTA